MSLPRTVRLAVIGAGLMGQGIAVTFLRAGIDVVVSDLPERLAANADRIRERLAAPSVDPGSDATTPGTLTLADTASAAVRGCAFALECVPEDLELKRAVLLELHQVADPGCVLLTNTSSVPLSELRAITEGRALVAAHFFNPAEIVPGVEVSIADDHDDAAAEAVVDLLRRAGKHPVRVAPTPGFIGNRLQLALFREAERCVAEGVATAQQVDEVVRSTFGFRLPVFGPFAIADMAGLAVYRAILANLEAAYGPAFDCPESLAARVEAGETGLAAGRGYHQYAPEQMADATRSRDEQYRAVLTAVAAGSARGSSESGVGAQGPG